MNVHFLIPLVIGFAFNWASAFTHFYAKKWGERRGPAVTFITRNILGIPVWALGGALGWIFVFVQARLEELDLVELIPPYRDYMRRAPRFLPLFRRS